MNKVSHTGRKAINIGIALFDQTGMPSTTGDQAVLLSRLTTTCGSTHWKLIHMN